MDVLVAVVSLLEGQAIEIACDVVGCATIHDPGLAVVPAVTTAIATLPSVAATIATVHGSIATVIVSAAIATVHGSMATVIVSAALMVAALTAVVLLRLKRMVEAIATAEGGVPVLAAHLAPGAVVVEVAAPPATTATAASAAATAARIVVVVATRRWVVGASDGVGG
jgi:hypothetical protein